MDAYKEVQLPHDAIKERKLVLTWNKPTNEEHLNWRQHSRIAEVWLLKNAEQEWGETVRHTLLPARAINLSQMSCRDAIHMTTRILPMDCASHACAFSYAVSSLMMFVIEEFSRSP